MPPVRGSFSIATSAFGHAGRMLLRHAALRTTPENAAEHLIEQSHGGALLVP